MRPLLFLLAITAAAAPRIVTVGQVSPPVPGNYEVIALPAPPDQFPPTGTAYHSVWRTIHATLPDLVLTATPMPNLAKALEGQIPVVTELPRRITPNAERVKRLSRTPRQLADELAKVYGHELNEVVYIPAVAVIARHRLGHNVSALVAPYLNGQKDSLAKPTASHFSGHLLFAELNQPDRVKAAADLAIKTQAMNNEMSDSVFMGCPILAKAGYHDAALAHLEFMQNLCLRKDGLYRHSPLDEAAWGRGNAFPALGMALMMEALPREKRPVKQFQSLIDALLPYQTRNGLWRQVIDHPTAYEEFSATAMIAVSIHKGLREGWLKGAKYRQAVQRAWEAVKMRTGTDGKLLDVCEGTGKQPRLEDYLNRKAIWDRDPRGGAMALLLATELLR
jgi:unsaturated rhamnogalacturonyl hydrolase